MTLKFQFLGGAGSVTGSKTLLEFGGLRYLIDCGLFQGAKELKIRNWEPSPVDPKSLNGICLTHAHIDHTGYLPRIYKEGFRAPIYCSKGTAALCEILLLDAARLQEEDAEYANRSQYSHHRPALPLFTVEDAEGVLKLLRPYPRDEWIRLADFLSFRFLRSGHIVGSSFIQFSLNTRQGSQYVTFSGDIGHNRSLTLKGPVPILESEILVMESTYGHRRHPKEENPLDALAAALSRAIARKGVVIIPSFAVGRAQEIIYSIRRLEDDGRIPPVPVILDSPMSKAATEVFFRFGDDNKIDTTYAGKGEIFFPKLFEASISTDESMMTCMRDGPMIVVSASGMLAGGRVLHHLKRRLPHKENMVLFVGFQSEGSKGRFLQNYSQTGGDFRIHHQVVPVEAEIVTLDHYSAHGDYEDILEWMSHFQKKPSSVFINHGTAESATGLAQHIHESHGIESTIVLRDSVFEFKDISPA